VIEGDHTNRINVAWEIIELLVIGPGDGNNWGIGGEVAAGRSVRSYDMASWDVASPDDWVFGRGGFGRIRPSTHSPSPKLSRTNQQGKISIYDERII
jgi:hypothetical protein